MCFNIRLSHFLNGWIVLYAYVTFKKIFLVIGKNDRGGREGKRERQKPIVHLRVHLSATVRARAAQSQKQGTPSGLSGGCQGTKYLVFCCHSISISQKLNQKQRSMDSNVPWCGMWMSSQLLNPPQCNGCPHIVISFQLFNDGRLDCYQYLAVTLQ